MSTIVKTEFGNYETFQGRIWSITPELSEALGKSEFNSIGELKDAIRRLREQRNREMRNVASLSEQNRRRLENRIEDVQLQLTAQFREALGQASEESNRRMEQLQRERQKDLERIQSDVSSRIRDLREQQNRTIRALENRMQESMQLMHAQIEANARNIEVAVQGINHLTDYVGEMEQRIESQFTQQQQQLDSIQDQLIAIESRGEEQAKIAIEWMEAVEKSNQLDRFVPVDAAAVRRRLQNLRQSKASGAELAALANEVIIAAKELEIKCNQERLKYEQKEEMTRTILEVVLEIVNKNRVIELSDEEGNPVEVENNFWSRGRYNTLLERLNALQHEIIEHSSTDMTIQRLDAIQQEIQQGESEIRGLTAQSVERVTLSQARMQTVIDIISVMEEQGWQVIEKNGIEEIDYKGGDIASDYREGAFVRLSNNMGEEVTVMVDPDEEQQKNSIGFHYSRNDGRIDTDEENERKTASVANELRQSGYEMGVPTCAGHMPMPEMESAEEMSRQGASERIRQRERANF